MLKIFLMPDTCIIFVPVMTKFQKMGIIFLVLLVKWENGGTNRIEKDGVKQVSSNYYFSFQLANVFFYYISKKSSWNPFDFFLTIQPFT